MMIVKKVLKWFLITNLVVFVLVLIIAPKQDIQVDEPTPVIIPAEEIKQISSEPAAEAEVANVSEPEVAIEPEVKTETVQEQMDRWDRGEFTAEEIAEIKAEEKREDKASAEFMKNQYNTSN